MMAGLLLTAAVVVAQAASQWIDFRYFDLRLSVLDSDHHGSVFGAMSILAEAVAAAAIGLRVLSTRRRAGLLVAGLVGVLIVPRALMRYEPALERYDVPALVAPLTVVFVVLCALTLRDARRVRFIVWGSLVLLACSFALHAVGPQADAGGRVSYLATYTWSYQVTGMVKHGAELAGWMLLGIGMVAGSSVLVRDPHRRPGPDQMTDVDRLRHASYTGNKNASERIGSGSVPGPEVPRS